MMPLKVYTHSSLVERFIPSTRKNRPKMLVKEFSKWTDRELDFSKEGKNAIHCSYHFKGDPQIKFPEVFLQYTTEKIFVMEFIKGIRNLNDGLALDLFPPYSHLAPKLLYPFSGFHYSAEPVGLGNQYRSMEFLGGYGPGIIRKGKGPCCIG